MTVSSSIGKTFSELQYGIQKFMEYQFLEFHTTVKNQQDKGFLYRQMLNCVSTCEAPHADWKTHL